MTSTRGNWLRSLLAGLSIAAAQAGASNAWAQGLGPDPFRPYNSQFDAYTYPTGPGQAAGLNARFGNGGANQFQSYLNELTSGGRVGSDRYGIGSPYYRSAVDSRFDKDGRREYRPNSKADQLFEQTHESLTEKYLAYFSERDPKKRAELLRDYNQSRRRATRVLSARRVRTEDAAAELDAVGRSTEPAGRRDSDLTRGREAMRRSTDLDRSDSSPSRGLSSGSAARRSGSIPPAPALPPNAALRSGRARRTPDDVLDRARRLDDLTPDTGASSTAAGRTSRPRSSAPAAPSSNDN